MKFWQKSLTVKLSTVFLFMSLVTVGVVGYVAWAKTRADLERLVFNQLSISAILKEGELDRWFDDQRQAFLLINQSSEFQGNINNLLTRKKAESEYRLAYNTLSKYLEKVVITQPNLREIFIVTTGGKIILSNQKSREGTYENLSNFTQISKNSELVPAFYPSPVTGKPMSTSAIPLLDLKGKVIGLVAANLSLERIDKIIRERTGLGETGQTYLVGKLAARNIFISGGNSGKQEFLEDFHSFGIDEATNGIDSSGFYLNHQGVPVIGVYRWLDKRNLALLAEMHQDEAFAPANQLALGIIIVGLGAAVMLAIGVYLLRILEEKAEQMEKTLAELKQTQSQLIQTEKMSGLGQMVAGVAHEINNPVNFIHGNLTYASKYAQELLDLMLLYQEQYPNPTPEIKNSLEEIDLEFIVEDLPKILSSMKVGTERIRQIVLSLRNFSRHDESEMKRVDIHEGIDSALMILQHRLKSQRATSEINIIKDYGDLPKVECYPGDLNQVFMNILANAIDALEECSKKSGFEEIGENCGNITICTQLFKETSRAVIKIRDNGCGMPTEVKNRAFDPFFTTKPVGKGTGLGLSLAYKIVVEKHGGLLQCYSEPKQGTEFKIEIPINQNH
ncbi:ATP-binding protein [Kamptonema sp. UHCC 0994]|uniref:sensor histidine kinase n=1 Tax=Kamptonema sp. UHCC 0994 TaxID=3031329 RepID=UPI0023B9CA07|nr:ATP-binding protein [Kamptonema sp. UHCC 0994]MDF0551515.1 ATP-binding protein [Kamptonema sp. UHCC 0994]